MNNFDQAESELDWGMWVAYLLMLFNAVVWAHNLSTFAGMVA